jgi:predicted porin
MKKTLIALAALAATGAFAQNVTVYGRLDAGYAQTTTSTTAAGVSTDTKATGVQSHNSVSSMWGLKGSEDLGGGMNAFFILEQDVYPADGNTGVSGAAGGTGNASGFNRTSLVGVNGGFGSISFGRDYNAVFKLIAATDVNALSRISTVQSAANIGGSTIPNLIMYSTPDFGGFKVNVNYGNQDTTVGAATQQAKVTAITGVYANGPLFVGVGLGNTTTTTTGDSKTDGTALGASYDFGKFKLAGNYITSKATNIAGFVYANATEMNLGGTMPMGKLTFIAQVGRNTLKDDGATDTSGVDYVLGLDYALSARTALFVKGGMYNKSSGTLVTDSTFDTKQTSYAIGLKTTF